MAMTLGVGVIALSSLMPAAASGLATTMRAAILEVGQGNVPPALMLNRLGNGIGQSVTIVLPLALFVMTAGIAASLVGGGLIFSIRSVRFDPSRLNPITGIRRLADRQAFLRLIIAIAKLAILAVITWQVVAGRIPTLLGFNGASAGTIAGAALASIFELGLTMTILLAVVALVDFVAQRRRASGALKMTKEEVKREHVESEGDPLIRALRRRRARQLAFARMMDAVPTADVVVTNPVRLAIALKYDSLTMMAPRIVAKGQRLMAARIKELAIASGVPIVEDVPLARALITRPLGGEVPPHLYRAVARILIIVHQARFRRGPAARPSPSAKATPIDPRSYRAGAS